MRVFTKSITAEVANLNLKDFDARTRELGIIGSKGDVDRTVFMPRYHEVDALGIAGGDL
jgi:site-specific recombinase XerD